ncbi:MAG: CotH kinase family protein [Bacteroidota bacterium]
MSFALATATSLAQHVQIDHWETVVSADSSWQYIVPGSNLDPGWRLAGFDASSWNVGPGGIGYGDGDDNTVINPPVISVFMRQEFVLSDSMNPYVGILHADFDDGFVAYLNGHLIAKGNMEEDDPNFDDTPSTDHEAQIYQGGRPDLYYLDPNALADYMVSGTNVLAIQVHNWSLTSSDLSGRFYLSMGVLDSTIYVAGEHPFFYLGPLRSELPILHVKTDGQDIQADTRIVATMEAIDYGPANRNQLFDPPNNFDGQISIEIRGSSSAAIFPKKNFGFETQDSLGDNFNVDLLGLPAENDWILHGPYSDKSLMRNALIYELGRRMGRYAPRTKFCELFLNSEYRGVYLLTEKIKRDKNRLDIAKLSPSDTVGDELTGGYILQIDRDSPDPGDGWFSSYTYQPYYAFHHPSADNLHQKQKDYIQNWIQNWENLMNSSGFGDPITGYEKSIDVPSFVDFFLANELTKNVDAYRLSAFLYKEKFSDGGKLYQGPIWDFNLGFGNADYCMGGETDGWAKDVCQPHPFWWEKLFQEARFNHAIHCRWRELRQGPFQLDSINHLIDSMTMLLDESQVWNETRWTVLGNYVWPNNFVGSTYESEVNYLKGWIADRVDWLDSQLDSCMTTSIEVLPITEVQLFPNPTSGELVLRLPPQDSDILWQLYDLRGRILLSLAIPKGNTELSMVLQEQALTAGMYFWKMEKEGHLLAKGKLLFQ